MTMVKIEEILNKLGIFPVHKQKIMKRYQKLGIEVVNGSVSDEVAEKIFQEAKEYICLNTYVGEQVKNIDAVPARAVADIKRYLKAVGISLPAFHETTFAIHPNTHYFSKNDKAYVDETIETYVKSICNKEEFYIPARKREKSAGGLAGHDTKEKELPGTLVGIYEYLKLHKGWDVLGTKVKNREKAIEYLEGHNWFGVTHVDAVEAGFLKTKRNPYYIYQSDISYLDENMGCFFEEFELSEEDKLKLILKKSNGNEALQLFYTYVKEKNMKIVPSITDDARLLAELPEELNQILNEDMIGLLGKTKSKAGKQVMMDFANWVRNKTNVRYDQLLPIAKPKEKVLAYTLDEYYAFCFMVFSEGHIKKEQMVEKALSDARFIGMWLYHSILAVMNLRGSDIVKIVGFLELEKDAGFLPGLPRNADKLKEMILGGQVPAKTYYYIGCWFVQQFTYKRFPVNKTNTGEVVGRLTSALMEHFGRLMLIAEVHHMYGEEQVVNANQAAFYNGQLTLKAFYGKEMALWLGRRNFQRLRMNHTVSQLEEKAARENGMNGLTAVTIAGYSRGHTSLNTMLHYIGDHNLTGDDASVVLWAMMERQVLGAVPYLALMSLFPDTFARCTQEEQTKILNLSGLTAINIETTLQYRLKVEEFEESFFAEDREGTVEVFKALLAIGQGYGASLDEGCFCTYRARGYKCPRNVQGSCIATDCKHNILTAYAVPSMVRMIRNTQKRAEKGDRKALAVLETRLKPNFKAVRRCLKGLLTQDEIKAVDSIACQMLEIKK